VAIFRLFTIYQRNYIDMILCFHFSLVEPCPTNFSRVGAYCYHFSERELNWKSSSSMCRALGSRLAEMETVEENQDIVAFMQATAALRGIVLSPQMYTVM